MGVVSNEIIHRASSHTRQHQYRCSTWLHHVSIQMLSFTMENFYAQSRNSKYVYYCMLSDACSRQCLCKRANNRSSNRENRESMYIVLTERPSCVMKQMLINIEPQWILDWQFQLQVLGVGTYCLDCVSSFDAKRFL